MIIYEKSLEFKKGTEYLAYKLGRPETRYSCRSWKTCATRRVYKPRKLKNFGELVELYEKVYGDGDGSRAAIWATTSSGQKFYLLAHEANEKEGYIVTKSSLRARKAGKVAKP